MLSTLSARIFLLAAAVTLVGLGVLAWFMVRTHTHDLESEAVQGALRLSDTLTRSTRYSMLKNQKEDVYHIVQTVGDQPGIERIRIFNKEGQITFSTDPAERGKAVDTAAEACTRCHSVPGAPLTRLDGKELTRIFADRDGRRVLGLIAPIYNEQGCSAIGCHSSPEEQQVLGVLDIQTSLAQVDEVIGARSKEFMYLTYFLMLAIAGACGVFIWLFVHQPVKALIRGTRKIASGDLSYRMPVHSRTEIGRLAESFNHMGGELKQAREALTDWTETLELRVNQKAETVRQAQAKLAQSEKLASLGSLSAVVAHEINNPLSGILTYTKLVRKLLKNGASATQNPEMLKYLEAMESETARCGKIVANLLAFSRQSAISIESADLNGILEKTLFLIGHKLELQGIALQKELESGLPSVWCEADQIQQAIFAVLINAIEAMPEGGTLTVKSAGVVDDATGGTWIEITITDSGAGIPNEVLPHLFEPFFTTKENKKGVGLGLSVIYGIVKRHHGRIDVRSEPGAGATFVLALPEKPVDATGAATPSPIADDALHPQDLVE